MQGKAKPQPKSSQNSELSAASSRDIDHNKRPKGSTNDLRKQKFIDDWESDDAHESTTRQKSHAHRGKESR